ncbi:Rho GTPase-activating protein 6, partial [Bulinus truncatus]
FQSLIVVVFSLPIPVDLNRLAALSGILRSSLRNLTRGRYTSSTQLQTVSQQGSCTWSSMSGRKVQLRPVSILSLTEAERLALQKVALLKLQAMDIGCPVAIPKENDELQRSKKSALSLKRRSKSVSAPALEAMGKDGTGLGLVFSIPLSKCLVNDKELDKRRKRIAAATGGSSSVKRAASSDSLSESESSRNTSSSLIDALSLSTSNPPSRLSSLAMDGSQLANHGQAQVPYVVKACFKHIETYGLQTLGIFRVGCSKKRVKQLREEFDGGKEVTLTDEYHPHDVAALLKEFFRDLPEPLLSRELYLPFLFAKRMKDEHKRHNALRLLISMLPVANRDTLWALLRFLATVSQHASDATDEKGEIIAGNKMDSHNLATLFGPNILHRTKATNDKELMSESAERVEQSKEIIEVVKDLIDNHHELFEISGSLRDDVLRLLVESNQEVVDTILKFLANQNQIEADPESMCSVFNDSLNNPVLYHAMNSDADLLNYARKQSLTSHRPLRVTKSADNSLDSPVSKSRATHLSESQAFSPSSKDNQASVPVISTNLGKQRYDLSHGFPNLMVGILPILRVSQDPTNPEVILRGRLDPGFAERPFSEGYNDSLNIPRPVYLRENSCSSVSSGLSSSLNSQGGSDVNQSGQWVLPTPPTSRGSSPNPSFKNSSSSSTLIAPSLSPVMQKHNFLKRDDENQPPLESSEWERWRQWEKIAAEKKSSETEQETLV